MTAPVEDTTPSSTAFPLGLRVAAGLCLAVGLPSLLFALALGWSAGDATAFGLFVLGSNLLALMMCAAAVQSWRRRKSSLLLVMLAWALPTATSLMVGASPRGPSVLMLLALITLAANWQELN